MGKPTERMRELERPLARIRSATAMLLNLDLWESHGRQHATPEYAAQMQADGAKAARSHASAQVELAVLVAATRAEAPAEIVAWADAHQAYLTAFIADCEAQNDVDTTATMVAKDERTAWAEVRAGTRDIVDENSFYVVLHRERYRLLFGIDPDTLERT